MLEGMYQALLTFHGGGLTLSGEWMGWGEGWGGREEVGAEMDVWNEKRLY